MEEPQGGVGRLVGVFEALAVDSLQGSWTQGWELALRKAWCSRPNVNGTGGMESYHCRFGMFASLGSTVMRQNVPDGSASQKCTSCSEDGLPGLPLA